MNELTPSLCINGKRYDAPIIVDDGPPSPRAMEVHGRLHINRAYLETLPHAKQAAIIANQPRDHTETPCLKRCT